MEGVRYPQSPEFRRRKGLKKSVFLVPVTVTLHTFSGTNLTLLFLSLGSRCGVELREQIFYVYCREGGGSRHSPIFYF